MAEIDDQAPKTGWGTPLRAYNIPGGPYPKNLPSVRIPKMSEYERGSAQDRAGNRGH
jgi:hypothetical protein